MNNSLRHGHTGITSGRFHAEVPAVPKELPAPGIVVDLQRLFPEYVCPA